MVVNEVNIGAQLEKAGWRQGSIAQEKNVSSLLDGKAGITEQLGNELILVVASQSCDIAYDNIKDDPFVEFSVGRVIDSQEGNFTFNKNPRILHTELLCKTENADLCESIFIELRASDKIQISKQQLGGFFPDQKKFLANNRLDSYVHWLAARYTRPALPTTFNDQIRKADPKNKLKSKAKSIDSLLSGIYVEIIPDAELSDGQSYTVNLLGLVAADFTGDIEKAEKVIGEYAGVMQTAGMDVFTSIQREDQVSIATIKRFKRFYYDDLSFKNNSSLPPEI